MTPNSRDNGLRKLQRPKVWNKRDPSCPADAVYVGRPSKWGNPYTHQSGTAATIHVESRTAAVAAYREMLLGSNGMMESVKELRGKDLVCWCAPLACHADVLLEIANQE